MDIVPKHFHHNRQLADYQSTEQEEVAANSKNHKQLVVEHIQLDMKEHYTSKKQKIAQQGITGYDSRAEAGLSGGA